MKDVVSRLRRTALLGMVLLGIALTATACGSGYAGRDYVPQGGVTARNGSIVLADVWVRGPHGLPAGATTGLRLLMADDSGRPDALTGVSVPIARRTRLVLEGRPVHSIPVGRWGHRDLEWDSRHAGVELVGIERAVKPGQWFNVTFRFRRSRPIRMKVAVAPLAPEVRPRVVSAAAGEAGRFYPEGYAHPGRRG